MTARNWRPINKTRGTVLLVPIDPLVARLAANAELPTQLGEAVVAVVDHRDKSQSLVHGTDLLPRHAPTSLARYRFRVVGPGPLPGRSVTQAPGSICYRSSRVKLLPKVPGRTSESESASESASEIRLRRPNRTGTA